MDNPLNLFDFVYRDNHAQRTLFALSGTGGSKEDFLFLQDELTVSYNLVGLQGNVREHGMSRFFRRFEEGVFDQENLREESEKFRSFIRAWVEHYHLSANQLYFLGYSNGANFLLATIFYYPGFIEFALLLHPMLPFLPSTESPFLKNHRIFVTEGEFDALIPQSEQERLLSSLLLSGADITQKKYSSGHQITVEEINDVILFLA